MKLKLSILVLLFGLNAFAQGDINAMKTEANARLDKRIASLQEAKTCISAAADKEAMKACHANLKEDRMEMKEAHKAAKEARKAAKSSK